MSFLVESLGQPSSYRDHRFQGSYEEQEECLGQSTTLYVGNLSFYTTEEQIFELFSKCGEVKRIIMGLDRNKKTPCGFCFVEYYRRKDALACMKYINGTKLDERFIRTDIDPGFSEGRQFGRGRSGGQVRDEYRKEYDAGRGGYGHMYQEMQRRLEQGRHEAQQRDYEPITSIPGGGTTYEGAMHSAGAREADHTEAGELESQNPRFREESGDLDD